MAVPSSLPVFDPHANLAISTILSIQSNDTVNQIIVITITANTGQYFSVNQQVIFAPPTSIFQPTLQTSMIGRITAITGDQLTVNYSAANREGTNIFLPSVNSFIAQIVSKKIFTDIENAILQPIANAFYLLPQATLPTVNKAAGQIYMKNDGNLYFQNQLGTEYAVAISLTTPPPTQPPTTVQPPPTTPGTPNQPTNNYQDGPTTFASTNALADFNSNSPTSVGAETVTVIAGGGPDGNPCFQYNVAAINNEVGLDKDLSGGKARVFRFNFKVDAGATISGEETIFNAWNDNYKASFVQIRISNQKPTNGLNAGDDGYVFFLRAGVNNFSTFKQTNDHFKKGTWYSLELYVTDGAFILRAAPYGSTLQTIIEWYGFSNQNTYIGGIAVSKFFSTNLVGKYYINNIKFLQDYVYPTFPTTITTMLANSWDGWKRRYVRSDGCVRRPYPEGLSASFAAYSDVVSEGIGYALMYAVQQNDQATFDSVYNFAKNNLQRANNNQLTTGLHLMAWHADDINVQSAGGGGVYDWNWATDADVDAALALVWAAHRKTNGDAGWATSSINYNTEATNIINDLKSYAFRADGTPQYQTTDSFQSSATPWENNPSYISPAAHAVFQAFTGDNFWNNAITGAYDLLTKSATHTLQDPVQNKPMTGVGLVSDWCGYSNVTHDVSQIGTRLIKFSYDAFRSSYRVYWHWLFYSATQATTFFNAGIKSFFSSELTKNNGSIWAEYNHDGTVFGQYEKSMMSGGAYLVLTANDANNSQAASLYSNKLQPSVTYKQNPAGDWWGDNPTTTGQFQAAPSYFNNSWMQFFMMIKNGTFKNF